MSGVFLAAPHAPRRLLVAPASLDPALALVRSQPGSRATSLAADGVTWTEYDASQPRFHGAALRLLVEGARSNTIANPRCEGAAAGTPGTVPAGWSITGSPNGLTRSIVGSGTEDGIGYVDVRFAGTTTAAGTAQIGFFDGAAGQPAAAVGQAWTGSAFVRLAGGSLAGLTGLALTVAEYAGSGAFLVSGSSAILAATNGGPLRDQRRGVTRSVANASVATVGTYLTLSFGTGATLDVTLRIGWPQLEQGAVMSTPILPLAGAPATSARGADQLSANLAELGIDGGGACTLQWSGLLSQNAASGTDQVLAQFDDGTDASRLLLRNTAGGAGLSIRRVMAGGGSTASLGSMTAGSPFRIGLALNGAGRVAASLRGAAAMAVSGGPAAGLTTLRLGAVAPGGEPFGELAWLALQPFALTDAALAGAVAAQPG